jgi:hypothetical protein
MPVFETEAEELVEFISRSAASDKSDPELGYSYIFPELELSVWRPVIPKSKKGKYGRYLATIGVGRKGYYNGGVKP